MEPAVLSQLVFDAYECWKTAQKYEGTAKVQIHSLLLHVIKNIIILRKIKVECVMKIAKFQLYIYCDARFSLNY